MVRWLVTCATEAGEFVFPHEMLVNLRSRDELVNRTCRVFNPRFTTLLLWFVAIVEEVLRSLAKAKVAILMCKSTSLIS